MIFINVVLDANVKLYADDTNLFCFETDDNSLNTKANLG